MDWKKWIDGKTKDEIEERIKKFGKNLKSLEGIVEYEMILEYAKKFRPDLWGKFIRLEREIQSVTEEEIELKRQKYLSRMSSLITQITIDAEMRERPKS